MGIISIDDQPIAATFFNEGKWLTEFITPDAMEIQELYKELTRNASSRESKVAVLHEWVAREIKYKPFISSTMIVEGRKSSNKDTWLPPSITRRVKVGNCANKSFLLTSLLRNEFSPGEVHTVLGNLRNGDISGHAWTQVRIGDRAYIVEGTRASVPALVPAAIAVKYEPIHYFNDKTSYAIEGKTAMQPFSRKYSTWLEDYLDWAYIQGRK